MSRTATLLSAAAFAAALTAALPARAATNIVGNGGFETGDFTDWTTTGWAIDKGGLTPYDGAHYAGDACLTACDLSQTLSTVAGQHYTLSFAYNPGAGAGAPGDPTNADAHILWNGGVVFDIAGGNQGWDVVTINNLLATGSTTALTFSAYQIPMASGLDDVSVTLDAVPEPTTWAMFLLGFGAMGLILRSARGRGLQAAA